MKMALEVVIFKIFISVLVLLNAGCQTAEAKLLTMRPLSARQVYRLLHETGCSDAIPQGRVITQGLAAMTGFALGLTKGLGSAFLFDIITANVTDLDLANAANGGNSVTPNTLTTQEVCFNSRNARSLEEAEAIAEAYSRDDGKNKKDKRKVRHNEAKRRLTRKRRNKRKFKRPLKRPSLSMAGKASASTVTTANSPTTTATGTGTNINEGADTGTTSSSTTSTGKDGAVNCVVIQKPATW